MSRSEKNRITGNMFTHETLHYLSLKKLYKGLMPPVHVHISGPVRAVAAMECVFNWYALHQKSSLLNYASSKN